MNLAHEEFLVTEKRYLDDLKALAELSKAVPAFGVVAPTSSAAIFLNVQEILQCNETFAARCMDDSCSVAQLARAFIACRQEMTRVYRPYVLRHDNAIQVLEVHKNDQAFQDIVKAFLSSMSRQSLPNLLIKPVQRICRYPLLFVQLMDNLSASSDPDLSMLLQKAHDCAVIICVSVEDQAASSPRVDPLIHKLLHNTHRPPLHQLSGNAMLMSATRRLSINDLSPSLPKQSPHSSTPTSPPTAHVARPPPPLAMSLPATMPKSITSPDLAQRTSNQTASPVGSPPQQQQQVASMALRRSGGRHSQRERLLQEMGRLLVDLARIQKELGEVCL